MMPLRACQRACLPVFMCLAMFGACKSPLTARKDAGPATDATPDILAQDVVLDAVPDLPSKDGTLLDVAPSIGIPKGFRLNNHTDRTAYVQLEAPIACRQQIDSDWRACSFFSPRCAPRCEDVVAGDSCCNLCVALVPSVLVLSPDGTGFVPWNGSLHTLATGACSRCMCDESTPALTGVFEASVAVYGEYECGYNGCSADPQGTIARASARNELVTLTTPFALPYFGSEVVFDITALPSTDAGAAFDSAAIDPSLSADVQPDRIPATFASVPGGQFVIVASNTPADAGVVGQWAGEPCRPGFASGRYELFFSADGSKAKVIGTNSVQETVYDCVLKSQSDTRLEYEVTNAFAGGQMVVWMESGVLTAQFSLYGSGRPVVMCIQSPMQLVR